MAMAQDKVPGKHADHPNVLEFIRLRQKVDWPIAKIADQLRVDRTAVYRWVAGDMIPHETRLAYFASLIGEPAHLGSERLMDRAAPRALDDWERELLDVIRPIPPKERAAFTKSLAEVVKVLRTPLDYGKPAKKKPARPVSSPEAARAAAAAARKAAALAGAPLSDPAVAPPSTPATPPPVPDARETTRKQPPQKPSSSPP